MLLKDTTANAAGNYVASSNGPTPGFLMVDVSLAANFTILVQSLSRGTFNLHWKLF